MVMKRVLHLAVVLPNGRLEGKGRNVKDLRVLMEKCEGPASVCGWLWWCTLQAGPADGFDKGPRDAEGPLSRSETGSFDKGPRWGGPCHGPVCRPSAFRVYLVAW